MVSPPSDPDPIARGEACYERTDRLVKCALAAVVLGTVLAGVAVWTSGTRSVAQSYADQVSDAEQRYRIETFDALQFLPLALVSAADRSKAIDSMNLPPALAQSLSARCAEPGLRTTGETATPLRASPVLRSPHPLPGPPSLVVASHARWPALEKSCPARVASASIQSAPERLAWITLWDSDREDGDAVRIESNGYSRIVVLSKQGTPFAIPVPTDGKISFSGLRDGDGGGITVGVASGSAIMLLPVMSVGEVLTLNVKAD